MIYRTEVGHKIYVWNELGKRPADVGDYDYRDVVISGHGAKSNTYFTVPSGIDVYFYGPDGESLSVALPRWHHCC